MITKLPDFRTTEQIFRDFGVDQNTLTVDEKIELLYLLENRNKTWAHKKLVNVWGLQCDSDTDGCNGNYNSGSEKEQK